MTGALGAWKEQDWRLRDEGSGEGGLWVNLPMGRGVKVSVACIHTPEAPTWGASSGNRWQGASLLCTSAVLSVCGHSGIAPVLAPLSLCMVAMPTWADGKDIIVDLHLSALILGMLVSVFMFIASYSISKRAVAVQTSLH